MCNPSKKKYILCGHTIETPIRCSNYLSVPRRPCNSRKWTFSRGRWGNEEIIVGYCEKCVFKKDIHFPQERNLGGVQYEAPVQQQQPLRVRTFERGVTLISSPITTPVEDRYSASSGEGHEDAEGDAEETSRWSDSEDEEKSLLGRGRRKARVGVKMVLGSIRFGKKGKRKKEEDPDKFRSGEKLVRVVREDVKGKEGKSRSARLSGGTSSDHTVASSNTANIERIRPVGNMRGNTAPPAAIYPERTSSMTPETATETTRWSKLMEQSQSTPVAKQTTSPILETLIEEIDTYSAQNSRWISEDARLRQGGGFMEEPEMDDFRPFVGGEEARRKDSGYEGLGEVGRSQGRVEGSRDRGDGEGGTMCGKSRRTGW